MSKRGGGIFSLPIMIFFILLLVWVWAIILPTAVVPIIDDTISGDPGIVHGDGVEFILRMLPWMVPLIIVIGLLWLGVVG